jgi:hypothetical protein
VFYLDFLAEAHRRVSPQAYLEIGVAHGRSLALSSCRSVGIDPWFSITSPLNGDVALFRTTSDEYFSGPDPLGATSGLPFQLAFLDGLHLFEFTLRDFISAERHSTANGVIIFDDVLPRSVDEAARERHTSAWTGDVFLILQVLSRYRPDLIVVPLNTQPTGLLAVFGLDPTSTTLAERFHEILQTYRRHDPQEVPPDILDRSTVVAPERFLAAGIFEHLGGSDSSLSADDVAVSLRPRVAERLGRGFVAQPT